ncbi:MAG TPA: S53 family peptidase [Acidimicrobiales bacterium]|nr:S53 family peptidase [Acidimicrobiales bacterium]
MMATLRRRALGLSLAAVIVAAPATSAAGLVPSSATSPPLAASSLPHLQPAPELPRGSVRVGRLPESSQLRLSVLIPSQDPGGLAALADAVSQPGGRERGAYLSESQFAERFGGDPAVISALRSRLRAEGLAVTDVTADHLSLTVHGPAGAVERAFGVSLVRQRVGGRTFFANTSPATIPAGAAGVLGLDTVALAGTATTSLRAAQNSSACPVSGSGSAYLPSQIAQAYGLDSLYANGFSGAGQTIASFELADYSDADVSLYTSCFGGSDANVSRVLTDGGASIGSGTSEATADVENLLGLAPDLHILVYEAPDSAQGIYDNYAAIISQDRAQVLATSWGQCEPFTTPAMEAGENTLFQEAAVQGQTVVAASGDSGSEDCYQAGVDPDPELAVDDPASQPYVTGVGGTSLLSASPRSETVWNASGGAGGGGISQDWAMPAYQHGTVSSLSSGSPCGAGSGDCREVPDVSASADANHGYYFYCEAGDCAGAGWASVGGTSLASPVWAALVALSNQACPAGPAGFINPTLYEVGGGATVSGATNDVVAGNNDLLNLYGLYPAAPGYDMASGLGSPVAPVLAAELCSTATATASRSAVPGYRLVASDGGIFDYGSAGFYGSTGAERLNQPVVGMTAAPDGRGYWLVAADGGIFTFGDAGFFGSTGAERLNQPIVGMAATADGRGYWLVAADGGIFTFGDAGFYGSGSGRIGRSRVVGMAPDTATGGYWISTASGVVFAFNAPSFGPAPTLTAPVVGLAATPDDAGLRLAGSDGNVYSLGDATDRGNLQGTALARPVVGIASTPSGDGYWLVASDGGIFSFGDAAFLGSAGAIRLVRPIVGMAASP